MEEKCIIYKKGLVDTDGDSVHGVIKFAERLIEINSDSPLHIQKETILHETIHGILHHSGLAEIIDNKLDEAIVRAITSGLSVLGLDNTIADLTIEVGEN